MPKKIKDEKAKYLLYQLYAGGVIRNEI